MDRADRRDEAAAIDAALRDRLEGLLDALAPGWIRRGRRGYLAPVSRADLGSWQVDLEGPNRGRWTRFSQGIAGGPVALIAYVRSGERGMRIGREDFDWARDFLGWTDRRPATLESETARVRREARRRAEAAGEAARRMTEAERLAALWSRSAPGSGTPVETYLDSRGIDVAALGGVPDVLRFRPSYPYFAPSPGGGRARRIHEGPAMIAAIAATDGRICGLHCTWLAADGRAKADIADPETGELLPARKMRGSAAGGCVRLAEAERELVLAEGIETTLSVMAATGVPGWAALSLGNLDAPLPAIVRTVWLAVDSDERDRRAAARAKAAAANAHAAARRAVRLLVPPAGCDWNDVARGRLPASGGA